jgi:hypothetical protein
MMKKMPKNICFNSKSAVDLPTTGGGCFPRSGGSVASQYSSLGTSSSMEEEGDDDDPFGPSSLGGSGGGGKLHSRSATVFVLSIFLLKIL